MNIDIETVGNGGNHLAVSCPDHPHWPERARDLDGKPGMHEGRWYFPRQGEQKVRHALIQVFGTDGSPTETRDLSLNLSAAYHDHRTRQGTHHLQELVMLGRRIARRPRWDKSVELGPGVVKVKGGFPRTGGGFPSPNLDPYDRTVVVVKDVPRRLADTMLPYVDVLEEGDLTGHEQSLVQQLLELNEERREEVLEVMDETELEPQPLSV